LITVVLVILAACGNSRDESSTTLNNKSQNNNSSQTTNDDSFNVNSIENASNIDNTDTEGNNVSAKEENLSKNTTANLKEEYLKKLNDAKNEVEEMRKNPIDDTTFALKKVEGDAYNIWDGLLNEVYGVLKKQLTTEEMDQLRNKQREWLTYRDTTAKEESLKFKGGTLEQYEYVRVVNNLTEDRCFELVENYMK
jgi:uncharacterized protein YecT (DUF1311 family)